MVRVLQQTPGHFEPVQSGHLDVEEDHIRLRALDRRQRLRTIARLRHHFHLVQAAELEAQLLARELFVVHDHDAEHQGLGVGRGGVGGCHAVICSTATMPGSSMRTLVPTPGSLDSVSCDAAP